MIRELQEQVRLHVCVGDSYPGFRRTCYDVYGHALMGLEGFREEMASKGQVIEHGFGALIEYCLRVPCKPNKIRLSNLSHSPVPSPSRFRIHPTLGTPKGHPYKPASDRARQSPPPFQSERPIRKHTRRLETLAEGGDRHCSVALGVDGYQMPDSAHKSTCSISPNQIPLFRLISTGGFLFVSDAESARSGK